MASASATYRIVPSQLGELEFALGRHFDKFVAQIHRASARGAIRILEKATDNAPPASRHGKVGALASRRMRRAWRVRGIGAFVMVDNEAVDPRDGTEYAGYADAGQRPGRWPSFRKIADWVPFRFPQATTKREIERIAYLVCRAIQRRGLWPRRIVLDSGNKIIAHHDKVLSAAISRELTRLKFSDTGDIETEILASSGY